MTPRNFGSCPDADDLLQLMGCRVVIVRTSNAINKAHRECHAVRVFDQILEWSGRGTIGCGLHAGSRCQPLLDECDCLIAQKIFNHATHRLKSPRSCLVRSTPGW